MAHSPTTARRPSEHIRRKAASNIHHAVRLAETIGCPFTHFVTINFERAGIPEHAVHEVFQYIREVKFGPWCRRPGRGLAHLRCSPTFAWVREATGAYGAHWLLHIPKGREEQFAEKLQQWLAEAAGHPVGNEVVDIKPAYNPWGAKLYMLKGTDPVYAPFYGVRAGVVSENGK